MAKPKTLLIRDPKHFAAVASPARQELLQILGRSKRMSVNELAEAIGRSPNALYHHLRRLEEAGAIAVMERRKRGKRYEAVYGVTADRIALGPDPRSPASLEAAQGAVNATFRLAAREVGRALASESLRRKGPDRELHAARGKARLSRSALRKINRHMDAIERILREECDKGDRGPVYAWTGALTRCEDKWGS